MTGALSRLPAASCNCERQCSRCDYMDRRAAAGDAIVDAASYIDDPSNSREDKAIAKQDLNRALLTWVEFEGDGFSPTIGDIVVRAVTS